jgi:hypothetical protein
MSVTVAGAGKAGSGSVVLREAGYLFCQTRKEKLVYWCAGVLMCCCADHGPATTLFSSRVHSCSTSETCMQATQQASQAI